VYEDANGQVYITYNNPFYTANHHGIKDSEQELNEIANALETVAQAAAR